MWWLLRTFGFDGASVLNGGWQKWSREGRPVETGPAKPYPPGHFVVREQRPLMVGKEEVLQAIGDDGVCTINALLRCPVHDIRIARRRSQGVVIFKLGDGERVVSMARLPEVSDENGEAVTEESPENQEANEGDL